jgi:hypothetical protein
MEAIILLQKKFTWNRNSSLQLESFFSTFQYMDNSHKQVNTDAVISKAETFIGNKPEKKSGDGVKGMGAKNRI